MQQDRKTRCFRSEWTIQICVFAVNQSGFDRLPFRTHVVLIASSVGLLVTILLQVEYKQAAYEAESRNMPAFTARGDESTYGYVSNILLRKLLKLLVCRKPDGTGPKTSEMQLLSFWYKLGDKAKKRK